MSPIGKPRTKPVVKDEDLQTLSPKEEKDKSIKHRSFVDLGDKIAEQAYDKGRSFYIIYNYKTNKIEKQDEIELENWIYKPLNAGNIIEEGVLSFPTSVEEYESTKKLCREVERFIIKYWQASKEFDLQLAIHYIFFTHVAYRFSELPYLRLLGTWGTGKSRFLDVVGGLCYKPILVASAFTISVLFHLASLEGTILADEADFLGKSELWQGVVKILNSGYQRGRPVVRMREAGKGKAKYEPMAYQVYGPKILAMRQEIKDPALRSRFLTIHSKELDKEDIPVNLPNYFFTERQKLQNKLLLWRFRNYRNISLDMDLQSKLKMIEPRMKQIAIPILSTIEDDIKKAKLIQYFNELAMELVEERRNTAAYKVYSALKEFAVGGSIPITVGDVAKRVNNSIADPKHHITPHKCGRIIRQELGLETVIDRSGYRCVMFSDKDMLKLGRRFGENQ